MDQKTQLIYFYAFSKSYPLQPHICCFTSFSVEFVGVYVGCFTSPWSSLWCISLMGHGSPGGVCRSSRQFCGTRLGGVWQPSLQLSPRAVRATLIWFRCARSLNMWLIFALSNWTSLFCSNAESSSQAVWTRHSRRYQLWIVMPQRISNMPTSPYYAFGEWVDWHALLSMCT